jgi:hypothetical protein
MTDYENIAAHNWSSIKHIGVSPLLYRWRLAHPEPKKPAFTFGGAVHTAVLEPEHFDSRYAVFKDEEEVDDGEGGKRTKKKQRRGKGWEAWQKDNPGREALKPNEMDRVRAIAGAVLGHRVAAGLLRGGRREEAVTWTDAETGLPCKGRLDYIRPELFCDLKTTRDPSPVKFGQSCHNYGYVGQVAFYHDGAVAARLIPGAHRPYLIAAQTSGPYDVAVYQLTEADLQLGRRIYRSLLRTIVQCTDSGIWPGVAPDLSALVLPPWAEGQRFKEEETEEEIFR